MPRYEWKSGFHAAVHADEVMCELLELGVRETGITPEMVLEQARSEESILHRFFEWDDHEAAEKYRVEQAKSLLRAIVVIPEDVKAPTTIRAVVRVGDGMEKGRYWETERAMSDEDMRRRVLLDAARDAQAMSVRYRSLASYSEKLADAADKMVELAEWLSQDELELAQQKSR